MVLAVTCLGISAILAVIGWAGASGRLRRNAFAGIRLDSTMSSDVAWQAGHRAAARWFYIAAVVAFLCGLGGVVAALAGRSDATTVLGWVGLGAALGLMAPAVVTAERAARATRR